MPPSNNPMLPIRPLNYAHYISMLRQYKDKFKLLMAQDFKKLTKERL